MTVRGEKRGERTEGEDSRYHLVERSYGSFTRSFQLPQGLDESKIEAEANNGILSIRIPKAALPQPRRIEIGKAAGSRRGGQSGRQISQQDATRVTQGAQPRSQTVRAEAPPAGA
ncbi:MAG: Hsp20/alpha crystallin family protein [Gemmatimonadaceae bacterium]